MPSIPDVLAIQVVQPDLGKRPVSGCLPSATASARTWPIPMAILVRSADMHR